MYQLDFGRSRENEMLTYAKIEIVSPNSEAEKSKFKSIGLERFG